MGRIRHQEGRVEEVGKVKKWKGHYYTYDQDGTRHHRSVDLGFKKDKPKHKAKEELRAIIERETTQQILTSGEDTFGWFWSQRFLPFQEWSSKTRYTAEGIMKNHVLPTLGPVKLNQIDKYRIQILVQSLKGYSEGLCQMVRYFIRRTLDEAIEQDLITRNYAAKVKLPADRKRPTKRYLTVEEIILLLQELKPRDWLICRIAIVLGLRPAELFALKWNDFDEAHQQLRIDESYGDAGGGKMEWKPTKTEGSNGWVSMPPEIANEIRAWRKVSPPGLYLFSNCKGEPLDRRNFLVQVIQPAAIRAGILQPRPKGLPKGTVWQSRATAVNFQGFRRTCATLLQKHGNLKDAQSHLRHASSATTMKHYIQQIPASTRAAIEGLDAELFGSKPIARLSVQ